MNVWTTAYMGALAKLAEKRINGSAQEVIALHLINKYPRNRNFQEDKEKKYNFLEESFKHQQG